MDKTAPIAAQTFAQIRQNDDSSLDFKNAIRIHESVSWILKLEHFVKPPMNVIELSLIPITWTGS
jgi:hypothetical protein